MARRSTTNRGSRGYRDRLVGVREAKPTFLIICEGEKTEPNYFRVLRLDHRLNASVEVWGEGLDPSQLLKRALAELPESWL